MAPCRAQFRIIAPFRADRNDRVYGPQWRRAIPVAEGAEVLVPKIRGHIARRDRRAALSRRDLVGLGLLTAVGTLALKGGLTARAKGGTDAPVSPPTRPFVVQLPMPPIAQPVNALSPTPQAGTVAGEAPRADHQCFNQFSAKV